MCVILSATEAEICNTLNNLKNKKNKKAVDMMESAIYY